VATSGQAERSQQRPGWSHLVDGVSALSASRCSLRHSWWQLIERCLASNITETSRESLMNELRSRRNNVLPGLLVVAGGVLLFLASAKPWIAVTGFPVSVTFKSMVQVGVDPNFSQGADGNLRQLMQILAVGVAVTGLLLLATRIAGVGVPCRLVALGLTVIPGVIFYHVWQAANTSPLEALQDPSASIPDKIAGVFLGGAAAMGLVHIGPATGLYIGIAGMVCVVLGCFVPAGRSEPSR
jgi:hypothetical protein